jgi:hypothetical protein
LWPASSKPLQQAHDTPFLAVAGGCIYSKECGVVTWSCSAVSRGREHARSVTAEAQVVLQRSGTLDLSAFQSICVLTGALTSSSAVVIALPRRFSQTTKCAGCRASCSVAASLNELFAPADMQTIVVVSVIRKTNSYVETADVAFLNVRPLV